MELPKTSAIVGMPAADSLVRSRKSLPPGMKMSFWLGRSAPPDSTREITGSRFSLAMSLARKTFRTVHGLLAPPRTVGSFATITHSTPSTTPMPVTTLAPSGYSVPQAASGDSSRNGASRSRSNSIRSRTRSFPRARCRATALAPPASGSLAYCSASLASMASRFARASSEAALKAERRTVTAAPRGIR